MERAEAVHPNHDPLGDFRRGLGGVGSGSRVLLVNPPVYDTRFPWSRWTQPTVLLRIATYLRSVGVEIKLIDALQCRAGERLRRKRVDTLELDTVNVNRWRFGTPPSLLQNELRSLAEAGWMPDAILIEGITTFWWQGVAESVESVQAVFPSAEVRIVGN